MEREPTPETWRISLDCAPDFTYEVAPWVAFLREAVRLRLLRYRNGVYTSYAWHDAAASQLRFATSACALQALPFSCKVVLVDSPDAIVSDWLGGSGVIPWGELALPARVEHASDEPMLSLNVWAREHVNVVPGVA